MPRRTSVNDIQSPEDLNALEQVVRDKRKAKRSSSRGDRRNRHYTKLLIKHQLRQGGLDDDN